MDDAADLDARVRRLAALADPTRLRIVDRLGLGDLSPSELAAALGIASNLLAHHLGVLEECGLVARHRSYGDRRRTYLRLDPAPLQQLLPSTGEQAPRRVVFVCTANSARSQLAAALWARASDIPVASAGTHPAPGVAAGARAAARRHGLALLGEAPRSLDDLLADDDYVVTVCDAAHEELPELARRVQERRLIGLRHWSIPDPVAAGTEAAFDAVLDDLTIRIGHLADALTPAGAPL